MANGSIEKAQRIKRMEEMIYRGLGTSQIARELGVTIECVSRYLKHRRKDISQELAVQQSIVRQDLINESLEDRKALSALISDMETEERPNYLAISQAYGIRNQIRNALARLVDAQQPAKHLHLHQHGNGNGFAPGAVGCVQILIDPPNGFDPHYGNHRIEDAAMDVESERTEIR